MNKQTKALFTNHTHTATLENYGDIKIVVLKGVSLNIRYVFDGTILYIW
ncbi:hypothetical protein SAMN04487866_12631 [Thermoactinomyces sp. DSM 45891]|nr:hypothetical protein SAMN04487866_12631 [Thermoactinomyces sp. DSM 45891]